MLCLVVCSHTGCQSVAVIRPPQCLWYGPNPRQLPSAQHSFKENASHKVSDSLPLNMQSKACSLPSFCHCELIKKPSEVRHVIFSPPLCGERRDVVEGPRSHITGFGPRLLLSHSPHGLSALSIWSPSANAGVMIFMPTAPGRHSELAEGTACTHEGASFQIHFY